MKREDITPEILRELLEYNPETGELFWKERDVKWFKSQRDCNTWNTRYSGNKISNSSRGYVKFGIFSITFLAHRCGYAIYHGKWPNDQLDHINGITTDNRIENLRDVSNEENGRNRTKPSTNTSGHIGVSYEKTYNKWKAQIRIGPKSINLGRFVCLEDAIKARKQAEIKYGFHENHGREKQ